MSDLEKWISGLESLGEHIYFGTQITIPEFVNLMETVEYLKSRRPVKPQMLDGKPNCGGCGVSIGFGAPYCWNCGREMKWPVQDGIRG